MKYYLSVYHTWARGRPCGGDLGTFVRGEWFLGPPRGYKCLASMGGRGGRGENFLPAAFGDKKNSIFVIKTAVSPYFYSLLQNFRPPTAAEGGTVIHKNIGGGESTFLGVRGVIPPPFPPPLPTYGVYDIGVPLVRRKNLQEKMFDKKSISIWELYCLLSLLRCPPVWAWSRGRPPAPVF